MRIRHAILAGFAAALASLTAPALAKHSDANPEARTAVEPSGASSCSALQQTADGAWARLPCQEVGSPQQAPRKSAARSPDRQTR